MNRTCIFVRSALGGRTSDRRRQLHTVRYHKNMAWRPPGSKQRAADVVGTRSPNNRRPTSVSSGRTLSRNRKDGPPQQGDPIRLLTVMTPSAVVHRHASRPFFFFFFPFPRAKWEANLMLGNGARDGWLCIPSPRPLHTPHTNIHHLQAFGDILFFFFSRVQQLTYVSDGAAAAVVRQIGTLSKPSR